MAAELHIPAEAHDLLMRVLDRTEDRHGAVKIGVRRIAAPVVAAELRRFASDLLDLVLDEDNVNADRQRTGINLAVRRLRWRADELERPTGGDQ